MARRRLTQAGVVFGLLLGLPSAAAQPLPARGITVQGHASVKVVPDAAELTFSVVARSANVTTALSTTSTRARHVLGALKAAGIPDRDLQTEQVGVDAARGKGGRITGYVASNRIHVLERDLAKLGDLIAAGVGAGANQLEGPTFLATKADGLYNRALDAALVKAKVKAIRLAARAGVRLGPPLAIREGEPQGVEVLLPFAPPSAAPVERGQVTVDATVTVTYAIR